MKILITGAEGFVGRNVAEWFGRTDHDVLHPTRAELDLTDADAVAGYFEDHRVDIIVHGATTLREVTTYPPDTCENNLRMFFNLERQLTPSMRMFHLGSGSEYVRKYWHRKMPESFFGKHVPDDSHSYSKYVMSRYIEEARGRNIVCLRIFGIFGKYEDYRYKFISNAIVKNVLRLPIVISQNVVYDYLCVDDFNRMLEHFIAHEPRQRCYNVTPTEPIDLLTIARHINDIGTHQSEIQVLHEGIGVEYSGDNRLFLAEAGDFRFTPYRDAIAELYRHYQNLEDELDIAAIRKDEFLSYAKNLRAAYFEKKDAQ